MVFVVDKDSLRGGEKITRIVSCLYLHVALGAAAQLFSSANAGGSQPNSGLMS